ncbi:MAG: ADP-forming succinate--CoA ligase subunit beta [Gammaproteobacteria bacterium]|nr:ADP-forming succinate--CoA ligase subunit beta [Gammaproteobacteria bacterium]
MNIHEFQAKQLFADFGIPVPEGKSATSREEAISAAQALGGDRWVVKAQVHAGGRGKAGGVKIVDSSDEVGRFASDMLGKNLVTHQTDASGQPIHHILVEKPSQIDREIYFSMLVDRTSERIVVIASAEGGMNIEELAVSSPEKILTERIDPVVGVQGYQCRELAFGLGLAGEQVKELSSILNAAYRLFNEKDASLLEINPLVVTTDGHLMAVDAKLNFDDNAMFRQKAIAELRDASQEDEKEYQAAQLDLNYIRLDGNIACMVNGAGLAMATMDIIKLHGGEPANFLDVGGGITALRVTEAFKLILSDEKVKAILVNIFGGIVRCDLIAEGIIAAAKEVHIGVPIIARLEGTNVELGRKMLEESGLNIITADGLTDAAEKSVKAALKK